VSARPRGNRGFTSGSGETQLELERRKVRDRLSSIKKELATLTARKSTQKTKNKPTVALIGYTNTGKTALLNTLADLQLASHDKLFETLSTSRKEVRMNTGQRIIFLDTIGFISRLPHELIDSFKATLEEIKTAGILVHVRDISHPASKMQREVVLNILKEVMGLDIENSKLGYIEVLNKADLLNASLVDEIIKKEREGKDYPVIDISATKGKNITKFKNILSAIVNEHTGLKAIAFPIKYEEANEKIKWLREHAEVVDDGIEHDEATGQLKVKAIIDREMLRAYDDRFGKKRIRK